MARLTLQAEQGWGLDGGGTGAKELRELENSLP